MASRWTSFLPVAVLLFGFGRADAQLTYSASLTGGQEVPPSGSAATGNGTAVLDATETQITVSLDFAGLATNATAAHVHGPAMPGVNAAVLFPLAGVPAAMSGSVAPQVFAVTPLQVIQLKRGLFYLNVHSSGLPGGEIRGQLGLAKSYATTLAGANEVPANGSVGTGSGSVTLNLAETQITAGLSFSGLTTAATAAHIHGPAAPGVNGPVIFPFAGVPAATSGTIAPQVFTITAPQKSALASGLHYLNVHSSTFPGGEVRGQLGTVKTYATDLAGTQEVPPTPSGATGAGTVVLNPAETQITVSLEFDALGTAATAAHIHGPAGPGVNAPVLFPLAGVPAATSGAVAQQTFAVSPAQVTDLKNGLWYFNVHSGGFPGGEIRGQIAFALPVGLTRFTAE